jgi:Tol biopolymer transport system component
MLRFSHVLTVACLVGAGGFTVGASPALGAFPGDNGRIAFDQARSDFSGVDIWTVNPDASDLIMVTADSDLPAWSADGRRIAVSSNRVSPANPDAVSQIWVMNADGSRPRQLTFDTHVNLDPAFSPDDRRIVFDRQFAPPDSDVDDQDILVMRAGGTGERNITNSPGVDDAQPNWSPDGRRIAFTSNRDGDYEIYTARPDGSHAHQLTTNTTFTDDRPNWSPDGRKIAFSSDRTGNSAIWTMSADDGTHLKQITFGGSDFNPAFSPDGKMMCFASFRTGFPDIFTMRANGADQTNLTNNPEFGFDCDWQPLP